MSWPCAPCKMAYVHIPDHKSRRIYPDTCPETGLAEDDTAAALWAAVPAIVTLLTLVAIVVVGAL